MNYDEFEATMLEAGWSLDEIEAAWQKSLQPDPWESETVGEPDIIAYQFTDADREDPTRFFNFMESVLDGI